VPNEKDEATTFKTTVEAITELQATGTIPEIALSKGVQNLMTERGWIPGLDGALGEIPEAERFPDGEPDLADDPAAGQFDPVTGKPVAPAAQKRWPAAER
jgi:hypothetical protein